MLHLDGIKKEKKPLVSIIVPIYNVEKYLERCVNSLKEQSYYQLEIILIDDGSTDASGELCEKIRRNDDRIQVVHKRNSGLGMARNIGLDYAKGRYVMFVDSDDYIDKNAVENLVRCALKYDAEIVATRFIYENQQEKTTIETRLYVGTEEIKSLFVRMMGGRNGISDQLNVSACTKLYSVELLRQIGARFPSERKLIWEDFAFNCDVFVHCNKVFVMDYAYYHYCYNELSLTHKYNPDKFEKVMVMYEYMTNKLVTLNMPKEAFIRINNMFMGNVRTCMKLEAYYAKMNSCVGAINNIRHMCEDKRLQKLVLDVPLEEMTKQQAAYSWLITKKWGVLLYILAVIQNKRKGNLIN